MTAVIKEHLTDLKDLTASSLPVEVQDISGGINQSASCFSTGFLLFELFSLFGVYIMKSSQMLAFAGTAGGSHTTLCCLVTAATSPAAPVVYGPLLLLLFGELRKVRTIIQIIAGYYSSMDSIL